MKMNKLTPNLAVANVSETVRFYESHFGFSMTAAVPMTQDGVDQLLVEGKEYAFAMMKRDQVELMFQQVQSFVHDVEISDFESVGASVSLYIEIENIGELHAALQHKAWPTTSIKTTWYGANEFYTKDLNGYVLGFGENAQ
jgi:uncharacterized glyoxalase superfamily protein PhnB